MLIDRHQQMNLFESILPASTAQMDAKLKEIDALLDNDELFETIKADFAKRYPKTTTRGRHSTPVEVILRMLIVKHLYNWSFEETEHFVNDSFSLRQFCRIYLETVPDDTVLIRWAHLISDQSLKRLHEHLVREATRRKIIRGRKLRIDTTVVETNIHYPTDSTLLQDGLRVLARTVKKAKALVPSIPGSLVRDFTRSAKRQVLRIVKFSKGSSDEAKTTVKRTYQRLCETARRAVTAAKRLQKALRKNTSPTVQKLTSRLQSVVGLVDQVIDQTRRRVVHGEEVPAEEKLVSIFEPTTSIHRRGKGARPTEFGHLVKLQETDGGIITHVDILFSPTKDETLLGPSLDQHLKFFGRAPTHLAADRGFSSEANEERASNSGVTYVALPAKGKRSEERKAHEGQRWFKRLNRFRVGIEAKISLLKRRFGLRRSLYRGTTGFTRWVYLSVIASNAFFIARHFLT